jgi:hypothetical protein
MIFSLVPMVRNPKNASHIPNPPHTSRNQIHLARGTVSIKLSDTRHRSLTLNDWLMVLMNIQTYYLRITILFSISRHGAWCRDSSLYGCIQTILQDLILDLLQCSDFCDFAHFCIFHISRTRISCAFRIFTYFTSHILHAFCDPTQFVFSHISHFMHLHISHISHFRTFLRFHAFSHFLCFDTCYCAPP